MAASTSTPTDPNSKSSFDVFLNHRGPDVKKTFASYLYRRLHSYGLKVFLDQQELQQGDYFTSQIEGAIRTASVHVAIFSVGYAESTWCLNELLLMLETNASIIPVFYKVKPTELRRTRGGNGVYAQALQKLEEKKTYDAETHQEKLRHDPETVEQWRNALSTVAGISGFEIDACNGHEGELLDKVVETVLKKVKKSPLNVAKYPTGLDEKVADFENKVLLQHQQSGTKPQVVGIIGLGGLGKTTLSKELFNGKSTHYKRCCFLEDVRENVGKGSLVSLQRKLLKSLTGSDLQIDNKDDGIEKLKMHLSSSEILLILDDVDHVDQMDALLPDQTSIHSNSLILITSRNKDVFTSVVQKLLIYKLNMLNKEHSLELFCCHAFSRPCPLPKFEHLTEKFVRACDGLPLSLKVLGALLHGNNDTSYWQKQLDKLEKILPSGIQERLRISYEALDKQEKHIFLDIACFFRGENRDTAIRIWNASGWEGSLGFETLQNKCLVEVVEVTYWNNGIPMHEIHMHDHLRDLGRAEAHVSQPLRFWHIDDLLQQSSVITVRGIRMVLSEYDDDEEFDDIQMRRLQLVDTEGILLERILRRVKSPDLIWLCWKQCPYASLPSWIPMKKLRVLRLSHSTLKTLWQQESQLPLCLEELRLHACHELKSIQGLAQLTKPNRLEFSECGRLEEVPSIETLVSLEALRIERGLWKSIRVLEQATKLKWLDLHWCLWLEELPSMETLVSLEVLEVQGCSRLKSIRGLEHATKLQRIHVSGCTKLEELPSMARLVSLEVLEADGCVNLKSLQGLEQATKLRRIDVSRCPGLEELPSIETLVSLEVLEVHGCSKLKSIRGLEHATKLQRIHVSGCTKLEELPSMERLVSLEVLEADGCVNLKSLQGLEQATKLRHLNVSGFTLEELPSTETLVSLEALQCVKLKSTRGLEQATKLQRLNVSGCSELEELSSMETLISFRGLWARACRKLKSIRGLQQATELQQIDVSFCTELEELPSMETLVSLEILSAVGCVKLKSIRGLRRR